MHTQRPTHLCAGLFFSLLLLPACSSPLSDSCLTVGGDKAGGAVLVHEGFVRDSFEKEVAPAHQAQHFILLLQQNPQLLLEDLRIFVCTSS